MTSEVNMGCFLSGYEESFLRGPVTIKGGPLGEQVCYFRYFLARERERMRIMQNSP